MTSTRGVTFEALGSLRVQRDGSPLGLPRSPVLRGLLGALLLAEGTPLTAERLADLVWSDRTEQVGRGAVQVAVSRLRDWLHHHGIDGAIVEFDSGGYRMDVDAGAVDVGRFRALVANAGEHEPIERCRVLDEALALWRGPVLDGLSPTDALVRPIEAARVQAAITLADAALEARRPELALHQLELLVEANPLDESLHGKLITLLAATGRPAQALVCYEQLRSRLAEELGVDPDGHLQNLHLQLLRSESFLAAAVPAPPSVELRTGFMPRCDLPTDVPSFTGREQELRFLLDQVTSSTAGTVIVIDGMAGLGKTALAIRAAHVLRSRFPDAQLYVDLHGYAEGGAPLEPAAALDRLLRAIGVRLGDIPVTLEERAALWRAELARRRSVIVLDNAANSAQVRPLLPGAGDCLLLVTSRRQLPALHDAQHLPLAMPPEDEAIELFGRTLGDPRAVTEPDAVREVVRACGYLPLAIRIAAARLSHRPKWTVAYLVGLVQDEDRRLDYLSAEDLSVTAAFDLSYRQLPADQQRLFRRLGLYPGHELDRYHAAALCGLAPPVAERILDDLVAVHLVQQEVSDRYRLHDLVRQYARRVVVREESAAERSTAMTGLLDFYLHGIRRASARMGFDPPPVALVGASPGEVDGRPATDGLEPCAAAPLDCQPAAALPSPCRLIGTVPLDGYEDALRWLEAERAGVVAAIEWAGDHGPARYAVELSLLLGPFLDIRAYAQDWVHVLRIALRAAENLDDDAIRAAVLERLGLAIVRAGDADDSLDYLERSLTLYHALDDPLGEAKAHNSVANAYYRRSNYSTALQHNERAIALLPKADDRYQDARSHANGGLALIHLRRYDEARGYLDRALAKFREGNHPAEAMVLGHLGWLQHELGDCAAARDLLTRALDAGRQSGYRLAEARALHYLGQLLEKQGDHTAALDHCERAAARMREAGDQKGWCEALNVLGGLHRQLGDMDASLRHYRRSLERARADSMPHVVAATLEGMARTLRAAGHETAATQAWRAAISLYAELGVPDAERLRAERS